VKASPGMFLECDIPIKQYLLKLDEDNAPNRFVICDLDDTHLFIHSWAVNMIREQLDLLYQENYYTFIA